MTWVVPNSLMSVFAPDVQALTWGSSECFQQCEHSLTLKSKSMRAPYWRREWNMGRLTLHRYGRMYAHSLGRSLAAKWISFLEDTRASRSHLQEKNSGSSTTDTCGRTLQRESLFADQDFVSLRTCSDTFRWDSPRLSATWKRWVMRCNGDYLERKRLAHLTLGNECSSLLPTPDASSSSYRIGGASQQSKCLESLARRGEIGKAGPLNPRFVEAMMGLPIGWTNCDCVETQSFQTLQNLR